MAHFADDLSEGLDVGTAEVTGEALLDVPVVDGLGLCEESLPFFGEDSIPALRAVN